MNGVHLKAEGVRSFEFIPGSDLSPFCLHGMVSLLWLQLTGPFRRLHVPVRSKSTAAV